MATTRLSDFLTTTQAPVFGRWVFEQTMLLSNIDQSPVVVDDPEFNEWMSTKGNLVWTGPKYDSLARSLAETEMTEADTIEFGGAALPAPDKITSHIEKAVRRLSVKYFSASKLVHYLNLNLSDPLDAIVEDLAKYLAFRRQNVWLQHWIGVFAANDLAPVNGSTHTQFDLTLDRSNAGAFSAGVTNFTAENAIDCVGLMGDAEDDLGYIITHSTVRRTMEKNDLLDVVKDSMPGQPKTYRGRPIVINDSMTKGAAANVFHTYFMGAGSTGRGIGHPDREFELAYFPTGGGGAGQEVAITRQSWCFHPYGYQFFATPATAGGPTLAQFAAAASWVRSAPEAKQVKARRLITTEF